MPPPVAFSTLDLRTLPPVVFLDELAEEGKIDRRNLAIVPISSGVRILTGERACLHVFPRCTAFRPERFVVGGEPSSWIVEDLRIGERSQLGRGSELSPGIPGDVFSQLARASRVVFETVQAEMDLQLVVTYVGQNPAGEVFSCVTWGIAAA